MQLTGGQSIRSTGIVRHSGRSIAWAIALAAALFLIFELDHKTGTAPVQHLYYLPIIVASLRFGLTRGLLASLVSVGLYHAANPALVASGYKETDVVPIALFVVVAIVAAKLGDDAHRLHQLAITDDLTGLHNLRSFEARLAAMVRASRAAGTPLAILVADVDRLKSINDRYGHLAGAEAVRMIGRVLSARLPVNAVACRYGGDEFAIALADCDEPRARMVADEIRNGVHGLAPILAGERFPVHTLSISVGLACSNDGPGSLSAGLDFDDVRAGEALFNAADKALYVAKARGRNAIGVTNRLSEINSRLTWT